MQDSAIQQETFSPIQFGRDSKEFAFVREQFRSYYENNPVKVPYANMREFGFGYEKKIDLRHKAFANSRELQEYFTTNVPLYASYSAAMYEFPAARPMEKKNFIKAELVFDLDADPSHEGHNPVICNACLESVRADTFRLVEDFLYRDFGFSRKEVSVNFSGSKGFHVHVDAPSALELSSAQRAQIVEYASGSNLDFSRFFSQARHVLAGRSVQALSGPNANSSGWAKKLYDSAMRTLSLPAEQLAIRLHSAGYTKKQAEFIAKNSQYVIGQLSAGRWSALEKPSLLVEEVGRQARIGNSVRLDRSVTIDQSRLIRIPQTLHGDTGFVAKALDYFERFDPSKQAVAFQGNNAVQRVIPLEDCGFEFDGTAYALARERLHEVPLPVAVLLVCKKKALLL